MGSDVVIVDFSTTSATEASSEKKVSTGRATA
jgi:hypothetical protein